MCEFTCGLFSVMKNLAFKYLILISWIVLTIYIFCVEFNHYHTVPEYYYLSKMLGTGLCIARATATLININIIIIIVLIINLTNRIIHKILTSASITLLKFYLEKIKWTHMIVGQTFVLMSIVHTVAHIWNGQNFIKKYDSWPGEINWARNSDDSIFRLIFMTVTGISGVLMLAIAILMWIFSREQIRIRHYNFFYYFHHSFLVLIVLMLVHPMGNVIKVQTNTDFHIPGCLQNVTLPCDEEPVFSSYSKKRMIYPIMALTIFCLDKIIHLLRKQNTKLVNASVIHQKFINLSLNIENWKTTIKPTQYLLLQCSEISRTEWHPFSVIKSSTGDVPHLANIEVMISARGDWTNRLLERTAKNEKLNLLVDGPFPSALEILASKKNIVFIAGGIGITPFISLLNHIEQSRALVPRYIHLIWIARDLNEFLVFGNFLTKINERFWNSNWPDRLNVYLFKTGNDVENAASPDVPRLLGPYLHSRISMGRPNWPNLFKYFNSCFEQANHRPAITIGCCGSKSLSSEVRQQCFQHSLRTRVKYNLIEDAFY